MRIRLVPLLALVALLVPVSARAATVTPNVRVNSADIGLPLRFHYNSGVAVDPGAGVDGADLIVVTDTARLSPAASDAQWCYAYRSVDGGATFTGGLLPVPTGPDGYQSCNIQSPPRFGADGTVYAAGIMAPTGGSWGSVGLWRSSDGGATFDGPTIVHAGQAGLAGAAAAAGRVSNFLPYLLPDPADHTGRHLYLSFTRCDQIGTSICRAAFVQSSDDGDTWSDPVFMAPPSFFSTAPGALHPTFDVGPDGEIVSIFWGSTNGNATAGPLLMAKSLDGGATFSTGVISHALDYPVRGRVGVDPDSGAIYFVYEDQRPPTSAERVTNTTVLFPALRNIILLRSPDGGNHWDPERILNTDHPGKDHSRPILDVAPNGRLGVWWYSSRYDESGNRFFDVVHTWSEDDGATFADEVRVTEVSIDSQVGPGNLAQLFFHYMVTTNDASYLVWTHNLGADQSLAFNDTYFAKVLYA